MDNTNFKFACPHCGQHLEAEADWVGMQFDCPRCGKPITVPAAKPSKEPIIRIVSKPKPVLTKPQPDVSNPSSSRKIPKLVYVIAALALSISTFIFSKNIRGLLGAGTSLPLNEIAKACNYAEYVPKKAIVKVHSGGRSDLTSYLIPAFDKSSRISFDISLDETCFASGSIIGLCLEPYSWASEIDVLQSATYIKPQKWYHIDCRKIGDEIIVKISGKKHSEHMPTGVLFSQIVFHDGNYSIKNLMTYPTQEYRQALKIYESSIRLKGNDKLKQKMEGIKKAAYLGLPEAQYMYGLLGSLKIKEHHLSTDEQRTWIRRAAEQGYLKAQIGIGKGRLLGGSLFSVKDEWEAKAWLERAAMSGDPEPCFFLGLLYLRGQEVPHDAGKAQHLLFNSAVAIKAESLFGGDETINLTSEEKGYANYLLAETFIQGGDGAKQDKGEGNIWLKEAIKYGNPDAIRIMRNAR